MNTTIPYYEIINRFLLGLLLAAGVALFHVQEIMNLLSSETVQSLTIPTGLETVATVCLFAVIYEIGYIINRISSVVTEEFLILIRVWPQRSNYVQFNKKSEHHKKPSILGREYDVCKGQITLCFILMSYSAIQRCFYFELFCSLFIIILVFSGIKCSDRINSLVKGNEESFSPESKKG